MRKQLRVDDVTMVFQWIVTFALTPFLLLPLYPRSEIGFGIRLLVVGQAFLISGLMTAIYLRERRRSEKAAAIVVSITALLDVALVFAALLAWPNYVPDLFWVLTIVVIVVATRMGYRLAVAVTLGLSTLYAITLLARLGGSVPMRTAIGDTLIRIVFMLLVAIAIAYVTRRGERERREMAVLSDVAAAVGATLELGDILRTIAEGLSEAMGGDRVSIFIPEAEGGTFRARETSEQDPGPRESIIGSSIDAFGGGAAGPALEGRKPALFEGMRDSPLAGLEWPGGDAAAPLLVLPVVIREEVKGIAVVERRKPRRQFLEREIEVGTSLLALAAAGLENSMLYADEHRKREESEALYRTLRELGSTLDVGEVAETACGMAMGATGARGCTAFLLDERKGQLVPRMAVEEGGFKWGEFTAGSEISAQAVADEISRQGNPRALFIADTQRTPMLPSFLRMEGVSLIVPFYYRGTLAGVLCLSDAAGREFTREQVARLGIVAGETALAIINARLHERISTDAAQLASLMHLTNAIGSTSNLTTIMGLALDTVRHLFEATSGLIYRVDDETATLRCVDSFGYPPEVSDKLTSPPFYPMGECRTVAMDRPVSVTDLSGEQSVCRVLSKIETGSTVCVGMKFEGKNIGVLHIRSDRPGAFKEEDIQLISAVADQVALALQRAILFEEISRLAVTDPLTGVYNVRRLEPVLADEISRSRRYERPVSFLMMDVDNLKAYNDSLGHQQGDAVLSTVARTLDSNTRSVDKVFRYGGDEFCIVLPETDRPEAMVVAEKVRRAVSEQSFSGEGVESVTISIGVAAFPRDSSDIEGLIRKADQALYAAKQKGRNSVAAAG